MNGALTLDKFLDMGKTVESSPFVAFTCNPKTYYWLKNKNPKKKDSSSFPKHFNMINGVLVYCVFRQKEAYKEWSDEEAMRKYIEEMDA